MRPLTTEMLEYAAQDVIYLPQVFECMRKYFMLPYMEKFYNSRGELTFQTITVFSKVIHDSHKCLRYASINKNIKDMTELVIG